MVRTTQPPSGTPINWSHPYAQGLAHAWDFNGSVRDLVNRTDFVTDGTKDGTLVGSAAYVTGKYGRCLSLPTGYSDRVDVTLFGAPNSLCQISLCYIDDLSQYQSIGCAAEGYGVNGRVLLWDGPGSGLWYTMDRYSYYTNTTSGYLTAGWNTIALNFDYAAGTYDVYVRGQPKVSGSVVGPAGPVNNGFHVSHLFGSSNAPGLGLPNGMAALNLLYYPAQPESKIKALMDNPWQIFA